MSFIKNRKIAIILSASICTILVFILALNIINTDKQDTPGSIPVISYSQKPGDPPSSLPQEQIQKSDANDLKTPTYKAPISDVVDSRPKIVEASTKQTEIRKKIESENVFFALGAPNDPNYSSSWALQRVNALPAWNTTTGSNSIVVAVIDGGFGLNHEDLVDSWKINSGETGLTSVGDVCYDGNAKNKSNNNCDDDNNGYIDDWRGWNFYIGDNNPQAGRMSPTASNVSHGTQVAGLIGAKGNNSKGIATISWDTSIMPLQVLSDSGTGWTSDIAAAIYYAVDNGADVINLSLGSFVNDSYISDAVRYAYDNNVVVVAAAGNCGTGTESGCTSYPAGKMLYPALSDHVIAVGASNFDNQRASFSSYGPRLDIMAPGSGTIVSPTWTNSNGTTLYAAELYGTSFASPYVASLVSLIKSIRPDSSVDDIRAIVMATGNKLAAMNSSYYTDEYGHGIINTDLAISVANSLNSNTQKPSLLQAGSELSERSFRSTSQMASGCQISSNFYCAIKLYNEGNKLERYLTYQTANSTLRGWSWSGSILTQDAWDVYAISGENVSDKYSFSAK